MELDPVATNPDHYRVIFENDVVRVLGYSDEPGARTTPHDHPDSVMVTLTGFSRRLSTDDDARDVQLPAGAALWLPSQRHWGENTGMTPTHVVLVELKQAGRLTDDGGAAGTTRPSLGPAVPSPGPPAGE